MTKYTLPLLLAAGVLAGITLASASGTPSSSLQIPYTAHLAEPDGAPTDSDVEVVVRVFADDGAESELLYQERQTVTVAGGHLGLMIGDGTVEEGTLDVDTLLAHPSATLEIQVDGELLGGRQRFGSVPQTIHADVVPASGVLHGDGHGLIPAEAIEPTVWTSSGFYVDGNVIPTQAGWDCEHSVTLQPLSPAIHIDPTQLHQEDMWFGRVGSGSVPTAWGSRPVVAPTDDTLVVVHAYRDCSSATCTYQEPAPSVSAQVFTVCVPPAP